MSELDRFKYEQGMQSIRTSQLDDESKYKAMYELEHEFHRQEYIRNHNKELEQQRNSKPSYTPHYSSGPSYGSSSSSGSGCLIVMGFITAFAGLAGVTVAKTVSSALDVKQPESITQPSEKATLISKHNVIHPKSLDNQHLKN